MRNILHYIWRHLPLPTTQKNKLKIFLLTIYFFLKGERYQIPNVMRYVPLFKGNPPNQKPVKIICFYLPQFHPIPENNMWWGEGFTEWTNVKAALPQFVGHYQPRIPGELGYYDLRDTRVQQRQIELAKLYGVEGFCFYFYWFAGKRLLETPLLNYLADPSLNLPFCLCWANENWTRRWDGLDKEVLISQQYSPEDDLAFIAYVAKYLKDPRYIRIDNKPLLLVYRPELLPHPKQTVKSWRNYCREKGVGEIYLAFTHSFDVVDPKTYDFDAATEFPPNKSALKPLLVKPLRDDFACSVTDLRGLVAKSHHYKDPGYKLWRAACPSWDNTARRKNKSGVFYNSLPLNYQKWLYNAIADTCKRFKNKDERLVFINAWNEWAEGAYLEPDQGYGYAYLEATRLALTRSVLAQKPKQAIDDTQPIAIVIHAFYTDIFAVILDYIKKINVVSFKLYVTCSQDNENEIRSTLMASGFDFVLLVLPNRGRDILPFLKIMPLILANNHPLLIKVHTKKSLHREDGKQWLDDMLNHLLKNEMIIDAIAYYNQHLNLGILGPSQHVLFINDYIGSNKEQVEYLSARMGVDTKQVQYLNFVGGTMFFARPDALIPLLELELDSEDFEEEDGQLDGTLAHAIERVVGVSALAASFTINAQPKSDACKKTYPFAEKTDL